MLKTRILTAFVLFAVFFCAFFLAPQAGWLVFATLVAGLAFWEWGGLLPFSLPQRALLTTAALLAMVAMTMAFPEALAVGSADGTAGSAVLAALSPAGFSAVAWQLGRWFYWPAAFFWLAVVPFWLARRWALRNAFLGCLCACVVIFPAWLALVQLRAIGIAPLLSAMAIVWLADIAAYFSGRAFGRHKLAPAISPGKTWEGAIGGAVAVCVFGFAYQAGLPAVLHGNYLRLGGALLFLAAMSVAGDLFESLLKRQAGKKDSGVILPGHGGILDRIDSLTSTLPLLALLWFGTGA